MYILGGIISLILILFFIRFFSEKQLDDLSPKIQCNEELLNKVDAYYVIPNFQGNIISENIDWCKKIKSYNKSLRMHGVTHEYLEFLKIERNQEYLQQGIEIFENCFNETPITFKSPQNLISLKNKQLIKRNMNLDSIFNAIFHKVYHCNDSGVFSNKLIDFF